jgi:hypothetical protein
VGDRESRPESRDRVRQLIWQHEDLVSGGTGGMLAPDGHEDPGARRTQGIKDRPNAADVGPGRHPDHRCASAAFDRRGRPVGGGKVGAQVEDGQPGTTSRDRECERAELVA